MVSVGTSIVPPGPRPPPADTPGPSTAVTTPQVTASIHDFAASLGEQRVTNIELFFDLVYVFAVTQMSHHLLALPTVNGALQTALLLALVWWAWVYTTWATNWLDARRIRVRLMLIALMLVSLVLSALPTRRITSSTR